MPKISVAPGVRQGCLTVVREILSPTGKRKVEYVCDCGATAVGCLYRFAAGQTKSCLCQRRKHGLADTSEYDSWRGMIRRCTNEHDEAFPRYGGRGIGVYASWVDSFEAFLAYMGPKPPGKYSLDRIDNNGGYFPGNVRWATPFIQNSNKRSNVFLKIGQEVLTYQEAARRAGISRAALYRRIKLGWPPERMADPSRRG